MTKKATASVADDAHSEATPSVVMTSSSCSKLTDVSDAFTSIKSMAPSVVMASLSSEHSNNSDAFTSVKEDKVLLAVELIHSQILKLRRLNRSQDGTSDKDEPSAEEEEKISDEEDARTICSQPTIIHVSPSSVLGNRSVEDSVELVHTQAKTLADLADDDDLPPVMPFFMDEAGTDLAPKTGAAGELSGVDGGASQGEGDNHTKDSKLKKARRWVFGWIGKRIVIGKDEESEATVSSMHLSTEGGSVSSAASLSRESSASSKSGNSMLSSKPEEDEAAALLKRNGNAAAKQKDDHGRMEQLGGLAFTHAVLGQPAVTAGLQKKSIIMPPSLLKRAAVADAVAEVPKNRFSFFGRKSRSSPADRPGGDVAVITPPSHPDIRRVTTFVHKRANFDVESEGGFSVLVAEDDETYYSAEERLASYSQQSRLSRDDDDDENWTRDGDRNWTVPDRPHALISNLADLTLALFPPTQNKHPQDDFTDYDGLESIGFSRVSTPADLFSG